MRISPSAFPGASGYTHYKGMDLRDWFAALAMQAILSRPNEGFEGVPKAAYEIANQMLDERLKP